jgi:hypothetical protein
MPQNWKLTRVAETILANCGNVALVYLLFNNSESYAQAFKTGAFNRSATHPSGCGF